MSNVYNCSLRRGEREWDRKTFEEIMTKISKFGEKSKCIYQETQQTPKRINLKKTIHRYTVFKLQDTNKKEKILIVAGGKWYIIFWGTMLYNYKETTSETTEARKSKKSIFKVPPLQKRKKQQQKTLLIQKSIYSQYVPKISFENRGKLKTFSDKSKLREFIHCQQTYTTRNAKGNYSG